MFTPPPPTQKEFLEYTDKLTQKIMKVFNKHNVDPVTASAATVMALLTAIRLVEEHVSLDQAKATIKITQEVLTKVYAELDAASSATLH